MAKKLAFQQLGYYVQRETIPEHDRQSKKQKKSVAGRAVISGMHETDFVGSVIHLGKCIKDKHRV